MKKSERAALRRKCIEVYGARKPPSPIARHTELWCPIAKAYIEPEVLKVAVVFLFQLGKDTMRFLFGKVGKDELMSPRNCMMMAGRIKNLFEDFRLALVPDTHDLDSEEGVRIWHRSEPKEYRIQLFDTKDEIMEHNIPERGPVPFRKLEGERVEFKAWARPRAQYLYFHYCCCVIQEARRNEQPREMEAAFRQSHQGTICKMVPEEYASRRDSTLWSRI